MCPEPPRSAAALRGISSMATAALLRALLGDYERRGGQTVELVSIGGVDALRRVTDGEQFDLVVLASDAIERLSRSNHLLPDSRVDLVRSDVAVAVPAGTPHPDIGSEQALRKAVLAATHIGYSTGPSGTALIALLQRWGIDEQVRSRLEGFGYAVAAAIAVVLLVTSFLLLACINLLERWGTDLLEEHYRRSHP